MFGLNVGNAVAPIVTHLFRTFEFVGANNVPAPDNFSSVTEEFKCTDQTTAACLGSMMVLCAQDVVSVAPTIASLAGAFDVQSAAGIDAAFTNAINAIGGNAPVNDEEKLVKKIEANMVNAGRWIIDLVNAAKKKKLEEGNVEGYFASLGNDTIKPMPIMRFINDLSFFIPDHVNNANFRQLLTQGVWTTYRMTRVSAGKILFQLIDVFRELGITVNGDAVEVAIVASNNAPHNVALADQIPRKYLAYGCIYHIASGTPIDKWYQGNKAMNNLPSQRVRYLRDVFVKYHEIKNNAQGLNGAANLGALQTLVQNVW